MNSKHSRLLISKEEYEALATLRFTLRQFLRFSEEVAQHAGLTPQQHQALLAIKGFPGREQITVSELAERLQIKHHSTVGLVNRMVTNGLLKRSPSDDDHRVVLLSLTPQGEALLQQLSTTHREELRRLGSTLIDAIGKIEG